MKDISFRPTKLILSLFEQIRKLDPLPNTDRNSIVHRAMLAALKNKNLSWQFISAMAVDDDVFTGTIPKHVVLKIDEEKFDLINEQIKTAFSMEKITIPYTLKLLLVHYLSSLSQVEMPTSQLQIPQEINVALLKNEYERSLYPYKKRLFETCKIYLHAHTPLQQCLTERAMHQSLQLNKFYDLSHYFPDHRTQTGSPTTTYLAKILAGWFIFLVESQYEVHDWNNSLDHVVKSLEDELQIKNESPLEKMRTKKDPETADYYKNVYARMMSR